MAEESFPGLGVWGSPRSADHRVDGGTGCRSEKGKEGIKTALLRWSEMGEVRVKDAEPELRSVLPEVGHFAVIKTPRGRCWRTSGC